MPKSLIVNRRKRRLKMSFGVFILGILFGWLAEWLYFAFFSSNGESNLEDCAAFERELKTRNEEIKALKSQLGDTTQGGASLLSKHAAASLLTVSSKPQKSTRKSGSGAKSTPVKKTATKKTSGKKVAIKDTNKSKSAVTDKSVSSSETNASAQKSSSLKKTVTKAAVSPKLKSKATKTAKQATTKKKPATKKISLKQNIKLNNPTGDDLTKLTGIGPSMAATLGELGITSYKKLAAMDNDILRGMLEASGARLNNNKEAMDSWNEQATLADKGDFVGLKRLQERLKS